MDTPSSPPKTADTYPSLTPKEKLINAIPLLLVMFVVAYVAYSCQQNRKMADQTSHFVVSYQTINTQFDQELDQCLHQRMDQEVFRKNLRENHLPKLKALFQQSKLLPEESSSFIIAFPQVLRVIELKIKLSELLLRNAPENGVQSLGELLKQINHLQKTIYIKTEKVQK